MVFQMINNYFNFIYIFLICFDLNPMKANSKSFIDEASQYTVRFRVLVDHPFVEDTDEDEIINLGWCWFCSR